MTQFLLWPRRPGDRVWPVRLWESAEQLRNKELSQAGIQISLEEELQLHGGNPGQATRARQTTRAERWPSENTPAWLRWHGAWRARKPHSYKMRKVALSAWQPAVGSHPSSSLDLPWEWRESASQLPKARPIPKEG